MSERSEEAVATAKRYMAEVAPRSESQNVDDETYEWATEQAAREFESMTGRRSAALAAASSRH